MRTFYMVKYSDTLYNNIVLFEEAEDRIMRIAATKELASAESHPAGPKITVLSSNTAAGSLRCTLYTFLAREVP